MISTRVMDIKLREAAEGLGEDGTGKVWEEAVWLVGAGLCGFLCGGACSVPAQCAQRSPAWHSLLYHLTPFGSIDLCCSAQELGL